MSKLSGIPGYVIRSYFSLLNAVRNRDHPNLVTIVLQENANRSVMGKELLTKDVVELLNNTPAAELWRRVTLAETNHPVPPCPESEQMPYDPGTGTTSKAG